MDATLHSLENLKDPSRFTKIEGVPIFRAHRRTRINPITKQPEEVVVEEKDLHEIVANMRLAEEIFGVAGRYTDGHIIPHGHDPNDPGALVPESKQPKVLALYSAPRVGPFGPKQIPAVLVDLNVYNEDLETVKKHRPFRSAEYYPNRKIIKGVAALLRDPELDMGVLAYGTNELVYYSMDNWLPNAMAQYNSEPSEGERLGARAHEASTRASSHKDATGIHGTLAGLANHAASRSAWSDHPMARAAHHQAAASAHFAAAHMADTHGHHELGQLHRDAQLAHDKAMKHHAGDNLHLLEMGYDMANDLTADEIQTFQRLCQRAKASGKLAQYMGAAMPSPTNTMIPHASPAAPVLPANPPAPAGTLGVTPSRPQIPGLTAASAHQDLAPTLYEFNAMKQALAEQQNQLAAERNHRLRAQAEQVVDHLINVKHKRLDRETEIQLFMACPDDDSRIKRAKYIEEYYDSMPNESDRIRVYEGTTEGGTATRMTGADVDQVIHYMGQMAQKGQDCSWEDAVEAVKAKKK